MTTYLAPQPEPSTLSVIRGRRHLFDIAAALDAGHFIAFDDQLWLAHTDAMNLTLRLAVSLSTDMLRIYLDHGELAIPDSLLHAYWTIEVSTPARRLTTYEANGGWFVPLPDGAIRSLAIAYTRRGPQDPGRIGPHDAAANDDGWTIPAALSVAHSGHASTDESGNSSGLES